MTGTTVPGGPDAVPGGLGAGTASGGPGESVPDPSVTAPHTPPGGPGAAPRRRGRPPRAESADTRDRILDAAREEFSERGYDKTSVRGIAKSAGVDSALVHHYFGTKEQVFEAAVEVAFAPVLKGRQAVLDAPLEEVGERMTRMILGLWENPVTRAPLLAIVRSAVNNETAAGVFRRLVAGQLLRRIAGRLDLPDAELRAELAAAQLVGIAMIRYVIKVEPLASADAERIVERVAPVVQGHLTGR
ncbi:MULTISPECIES: TetR/AcrR family transcriptional regulator [Streptomyces]|uniref:TetR/AcrR family transcriptional regulator n=1 Tax=Streptomyces prasinus TaxID=67345 RepID=A0ABX6B1A7_9ACTN|nr:TetR family transcriptional regulator [Streptomyces prasinus]QEV07662.1 TetR/AcrR family transcriptional regulator [Streptomyces prasinus]